MGMLTRSLVGSVLGILAMFAAASPAMAQEAEQPNILFIFSDDHSQHAVGAYGADAVETPNIDRLAERGVKFRRAYNMGSWSGAVCIASRSMLNTGRFVWHAQELNRNDWRARGRFWSQQLSDAGYRTYFAGKWHVPGANANQLFDMTGQIRPGMPTDYSFGNKPEAYERPVEGEPDTWDPSDPSLGGHFAGGKHWSEVVADDADRMLDDATERDEPFFMYLAFNAPHDPRQAPADYLERYPAEEMEVPENFLPEYPHAGPMGAPHGLRDERLAPMPRTEYAIRHHVREYRAIVTHMDDQIGRILDSLEETGELENTVIVFTADHGLGVGRHGLLGKQNMYEHSLRVPFIMAGPGIEEGGEVEAPIYLQDVMPTTLELAGVRPAEHVQFRSVLPLLEDGQAESYPAIYGCYLDRQRAVIEDDYKLILYPRAGVVRLFNIVDDPHEMNDLADDPDQRSRIRGMMGTLEQLQEEAGDDLDLADAYGEF